MMSLNNTENKLVNGLADQMDWRVCNDGRREIRIGMILNCNDELPKNRTTLMNTSREMIAFMNRVGVKTYGIEVVDNRYEYSNCLRLPESEYQLLKEIVCGLEWDLIPENSLSPGMSPTRGRGESAIGCT
jgi:hypothetical protein